MRFVYVDIFLYICIMNDKDFRNFHDFIYGVYGENITTDEERWYNFINKRQVLINSVRDLNKCGIEVDYSNRNKIIHNYE